MLYEILSDCENGYVKRSLRYLVHFKRLEEAAGGCGTAPAHRFPVVFPLPCEKRLKEHSLLHQNISSGDFRRNESHSTEGLKVVQVNLPTSAIEKCSPVGNTRILSNNPNESAPILGVLVKSNATLTSALRKHLE